MQMARAVESVAGGFHWHDRSLSCRQLWAAYGDRLAAVPLLYLYTRQLLVLLKRQVYLALHRVQGDKKIIKWLLSVLKEN